MAGQVYVFSFIVVANILVQFIMGYEINIGQGFIVVVLGSIYIFMVLLGSEMDFEVWVMFINGKVLFSWSKMVVVLDIGLVFLIDLVDYCVVEEFIIDFGFIVFVWDDEIDWLFVRIFCCDDVICCFLLIIGGFEMFILFDLDIEDNQENGYFFFIDNDFDFMIRRLRDVDVFMGNLVI